MLPPSPDWLWRTRIHGTRQTNFEAELADDVTKDRAGKHHECEEVHCASSNIATERSFVSGGHDTIRCIRGQRLNAACVRRFDIMAKGAPCLLELNEPLERSAGWLMP